MLRLDGRTEAQIATLIRWVQHDEFWRSNVLSMDKLREKFDALEMKRRASLPVTHKPNGDSHTISNLAPTEPMPAPNPAAVAMTQYKPNGVVKNA